MPLIYFYHLPANVARRAFRDVIEKTIQNNSENPETAPKPTIGLEIPDRPTAELKHSGHGYIDIPDDKTAEIFLAKLKVEPIMFESEKIIFSREKSSELEATSSLQSQVRVARPAPAVSPPVSRPQRANARAPATNESTSKQRSPGVKMNLNRTKFPQQEKREVRPPNVKYLRKLQHRLSVLGHHIRVERLEFGVLRDKNFSVEYSRSLIEETGWMIFEDDEKSIRVTMRGSHQDSTMPSVAISIQTVNYVGLGTEGNSPYMFLVLSQNPHFELGDIARPSKGNARLDAKRSRTRHPCLDERHERVAPFASRWIRLVLHQDNSVLPDIEVCQMAGLPRPEIDPPLTFNKLDMYSLRNITAVLKWVQSGSLRWDVAFQCEALFRNGTLVPQELLALRPTIEAIVKEDPQRAADALKTFRAEIEGAGARRTFNDFENKNVVDAFDKHINNSKKSTPAERLRSGISKSNFMCYHVKITPTAVHLAGPLAEQSNRVIRRYPDLESYFIRVSFTDEADGRTRFEYEVDTHGFTRERLGGFLKNRIRIGDRLYELLGYSQSGFRDHSCFFSAPFTFNGQEITAQSIRDSLGDFEKVINCPARYGARMSQAFSSTDPSVVLEESVIKHLPDIKVGKLEFTDGCATISKDLAEEVWKRMIEQMPHTRRRLRHHKEPAPCAFQIRIGGSKGMVRIDPKLQGRVLSLRPSMTKFQAPGEFSLEIARAFIGYSPCYLNRPLIMLLWTGGVDDSVFEKLMENSLKSTIEGMKTCAGVADQFMWNRLGASFHLDHTFRKLARLGVELDQPGVRTSGVNKILNGALYHLKLALKHKARIKVPDSYTLVGVCDEHKYLKPRQIYVCVRDFSHRTGVVNLRFLEGRVLVTRSPVIHPGDAQILFAIGKPPPDSPFYGEGNNLPNCVVFSSCGPRPVPNMLGGGDLDGDLYNIIQYREIIPPHIYAPAEYPPARLKKIDRDSTIEDVADFMVDYVCNDSLGMIATNHLVIASSAELRARDENCMVNAELHSRAVDFVKTGFWVNNLEIRKPRYDVAVDPETGMGLKPDWQAGHGRDHTDGRFYECDSVLGRLFRAVELPFDNPARHSDITEQEATSIKKCIAGYVARYSAEIQGSMTKFDTWINALILRYTAELNHICASHTISSESSERVSEVEVMIGTNLEVNSKSDLIERMKRLTGSLADFVRFELKGGDEESPYEWLARAWKAYILTSRLGDTVFGALSFSWLALESVLDALQVLDENFLSNAGIAVEPYSSIPSSGEIPEGPSSEAELQDFTWEKAEVEVEDPEGAATAQAENNRTWGQNSTNYRGGRGRGYGNGNGNGNGDWQGSNGYSNGGGYRGRGGSRGFSSNNTSRSSSGAGNGPGNYRSNSNRGRGQVRGRTPGWTVVAPANPN